MSGEKRAIDGPVQRGASAAIARFIPQAFGRTRKKDPKPKLGVFRQTAIRGVRGEAARLERHAG
jgi:hypothetical protein